MVTYNEEHNIRDALDSVRDAGEIIVIDSFSNDRTPEIAREYTERFYQHRWEGFARQKQRAIDLATKDWVLLLDADERVTPELKDEISMVIKNTDRDGYYIPRKNHFLGKWIRHSGWWPDHTLRLFRKGKGGMVKREVHERIEVKGSVGYLQNPLIHYTYRNINQFLDKMKQYSSLSAMEMKKEGRSFSVLQILLKPPATFIRMYLLRQGFRDGLHGLILAILYSYYTFLKYIKLWEVDRCTSE